MVGGEGGIRTHGTVTRTTVFEFYDFRAFLCRLVAKRVLLLGFFIATIPLCNALYWAVPRSWFAIWFANLVLYSISNHTSKADQLDAGAQVPF